MIGRAGDERESDIRVHGVIHTGGTADAPKQGETSTTSERLAAKQSWPTLAKLTTLVTTMSSPSTTSSWTSCYPSVESRSIVSERFLLIRTVNRRTVCRHRPAMYVGGIADQIHTDHRAKLAEHCSTQRCEDKN
uniref:Uncharacterized protein MLCB1701.05c n=1 Tax=Mycobacterium leprae TaxID=1769 RepID=Q9Z5K1_MYCLR|nr:hypothetical protein MLCB1701.05c [Mycobacterium leprae]